MSDVFAILSDDHRTVEQLFSQFEQTQDTEIALKICDELTVHAMVEEEMIYPVLGAKTGATDMANEARAEHQEAKQLISQIDAGATAGEDVSSLVRQLQQSVQHHVQEEESEIFPRIKNTVPELVAHMGDDVVERKKVLVEQVQEARSLGMPHRVVGAAQKPPTN